MVEKENVPPEEKKCKKHSAIRSKQVIQLSHQLYRPTVYLDSRENTNLALTQLPK